MRGNLYQSQSDRRHGRRAAIRWSWTVGYGPESGRPNSYLRRLLKAYPAGYALPARRPASHSDIWIDWLTCIGKTDIATEARRLFATSPCNVEFDLVGPVGERNIYSTEPRGIVACIAPNIDDLLHQITAALATGNRALIDAAHWSALHKLPPSLERWVIQAPSPLKANFDIILFSGDAATLQTINRSLSAIEGPIVPLVVARADGSFPLEVLIREHSVSVNTTAAGGNASLMMTG